MRPRWLFLTRTVAGHIVHGLALVLAGVLLMFPLGLVPFSNTLPAVAILFCRWVCSNATACSSSLAT